MTTHRPHIYSHFFSPLCPCLSTGRATRVTGPSLRAGWLPYSPAPLLHPASGRSAHSTLRPPTKPRCPAAQRCRRAQPPPAWTHLRKASARPIRLSCTRARQAPIGPHCRRVRHSMRLQTQAIHTGPSPRRQPAPHLGLLRLTLAMARLHLRITLSMCMSAAGPAPAFPPHQRQPPASRRPRLLTIRPSHSHHAPHRAALLSPRQAPFKLGPPYQTTAQTTSAILITLSTQRAAPALPRPIRHLPPILHEFRKSTGRH